MDEFSEMNFQMPFLLSMTLLIYIPSYFGQKMTGASEALSLTLFHSKYYEADRKVQSSMKIAMEHAKKPKKFRCAYILDISLETFVKIINSTYSLYAVLKNVSK